MTPFLALVPGILDLFSRMFGIDSDSIEGKIKIAEMKIQLETLVVQQSVAQVGVNTAEAAAPGRTWFTWREIVGFTCAIAFLAHVVSQMFPQYISPVSMQDIMPILMGMLGLSGLDFGKHYINSKYNSPLGEAPDEEE